MGCGLSKFPEEETGANPEVRFVYPRNEVPIVNEKDVGEELAENNGRKSLSVEGGFLKKVFGNSGDKDAEGDQGGRRSISCSSKKIMENGLFAKESGSFEKCRDYFPDENTKRVNSSNRIQAVNSETRFSVEMAREEARRISIEVAVREAERINAEVAKEEKTSGGTGGEFLRENSLLFPPGSPSFRIYCLLDKDGIDNAEHVEQKTAGSKLPPTGREKSTKRRRRTSLLRTVLHRGGSGRGVKNFLNVKNTEDSSSSNNGEK